MIGYLQGLILKKKPESLLLLCGEVGYLLECPASTIQGMPAVGQHASLYVTTHVREDAIRLFGFHSEFDKIVFETLIGVSAVGPKLALSLLGPFEGRDLVEALHEKETSCLLAIPGVGKRTLDKLLVEMGPKIDKLLSLSLEMRAELSNEGVIGRQAEKSVEPSLLTQNEFQMTRSAASSEERKNRRGMLADMESALVNLGYKDKVIRGCLAWIQSEWEAKRVPVRLDESLRVILQRQTARLVSSDNEAFDEPKEVSSYDQSE